MPFVFNPFTGTLDTITSAPSTFLPTSENTESVSSSPFTPQSDTIYLLVNTSAARTINLPDPTTRRIFVIKDVIGSANTNAITLNRNGSEDIEGLAANRDLEADWGEWKLISDGSDWYFV